MNELERAARLLRSASRVVVFTGAGVSAESGIPTFRDAGGLWEEFPVAEIGNWRGLIGVGLRRPERLAAFLHAVLYPIASAKPNTGHLAIAALEEHVRVTVITQNIDVLHQDAGSRTIHQVHGSLLEIATLKGRALRRLSREELLAVADLLDRIRSGPLRLARVLAAVRPLAGVGRHGRYRPRVVLRR